MQMRPRKARTQLHRMIGGATNRIVRTANGAIIDGTSTQRTSRRKSLPPISTEIKKREPRRLPLFYCCCVDSEARGLRMFRERPAPRERCAQLSFCSKPGGVIVPSGALRAHAFVVRLGFVSRKRKVGESQAQSQQPDAGRLSLKHAHYAAAKKCGRRLT